MRDRTLVVFHYAERASDAPQQLQLRRRNLEYFLRIGVVDDPRVHFILNLAAGNVTEAHPDSCPGSHATSVAKTPSWPLQTPRLLKPAELAPRPRAPGVPTSQELGRGVRRVLREALARSEETPPSNFELRPQWTLPPSDLCLHHRTLAGLPLDRYSHVILLNDAVRRHSREGPRTLAKRAPHIRERAPEPSLVPLACHRRHPTTVRSGARPAARPHRRRSSGAARLVGAAKVQASLQVVNRLSPSLRWLVDGVAGGMRRRGSVRRRGRVCPRVRAARAELRRDAPSPRRVGRVSAPSRGGAVLDPMGEAQ